MYTFGNKVSEQDFLSTGLELIGFRGVNWASRNVPKFQKSYVEYADSQLHPKP